ncbi:MAG: hypothetical protein ABUL73_05735 [Alphaproteobacteria bacterium]
MAKTTRWPAENVGHWGCIFGGIDFRLSNGKHMRRFFEPRLTMQDLRVFLSGMFVVAIVLALLTPLVAPSLVTLFSAPATLAARAAPFAELVLSTIGGALTLWLGRRNR